jgi:type IV pilus assembly protein PilF
MIYGARVKRWAYLVLTLGVLVITGACAQQPYIETPGGQTNLSGEDAARLQSARVHTELGSAYYGSGQLGIALQELTIATQVYPKYAPAYYVLGLVQMDLKDDAAAEKSFQTSISLDPSSSEAYNNYGWFLCQRGHYDAALKQFMTALRNPHYETPEKAYVNAGICSHKHHDDASALEYFDHALKLRPNHPQALYYSADIHFQQGDVATAKSLLLRYMRSTEPSPEALWLGARVERKLGEGAEQASYEQMLRQRYPDSPQAQLLKVGRYE